MAAAWLRSLVDPEIPEPVPPALLRRIALAAIAIDLVLVLGNVGSRYALGPEADTSIYDVFLAYNLPAHAIVVATMASILRSSGELLAVRRRLKLALAAAAWTTVIASWIVGGLSVALNLALATLLVCTVRLSLGGRLGAYGFAAIVIADLACAGLRIGGVFPDPRRDLRRPWRRREVPARVRAAIDRGLALDPAARWPSMTALCDALAARRSRARA